MSQDRSLWQEVAENLQARQENIEFVRISKDQGLSDGSVQVLAQDHAGFLWAGSRAGLDQYDGDGFVRFRRGVERSTLSDNHVDALLVNSPGELRVGTRRGLNHLDPETGKIVRLLQDAGVTEMRVNRAGTLRVGPSCRNRSAPPGRREHHVFYTSSERLVGRW